MICDNCKVREAEVYQAHSGKRLCRKCFMKDIRERVKKESLKIGLDKASKILLAVSGGKDSYVLADTLSSFIDSNKLIAYNITEGIQGYNRYEQIVQLKRYLSSLGIELIEDSFKQGVGHTLDEMMKYSRNKGLNVSACTFCGGFRRKLINNAGRTVSADYVATGHNLDDEVQAIIVNLIRGDIIRLIRFADKPIKLSSKFVLRVKPLRRVYEWETTLYAYYGGYQFQEVECPYISTKPTLRSKVRELLYTLEDKKPGALLSILDEFDKIAEKVRKQSELKEELPTCKICGEPTSYGREICKNCELLISSGLLDPHQNLPIS
ncbi:TIGR00269 family protein [Stygiolobus caldivivus]|uniref:Adenine nucleotide alpha hydrolase n=1 Tax=Stygiolobus caldivivus TaxID=2824673 RepID=A0A8D5ZJ96_9CREN|nr:TIGR00269 family protein [Stygiolobus caldivivus]BCU71354.1 adenine nucleotide alpha hydrolase [Stygiolobus caldivivus]